MFLKDRLALAVSVLLPPTEARVRLELARMNDRANHASAIADERARDADQERRLAIAAAEAHAATRRIYLGQGHRFRDIADLLAGALS